MKTKKEREKNRGSFVFDKSLSRAYKFLLPPKVKTKGIFANKFAKI